MVAPIDAKASFEVEGEAITLRFNFRAISLAEDNGIDLLNGGVNELSLTKAVILLKCLGAQDHPEYTEDHWLAVVRAEPEGMRKALIKLFSDYGGEAEGNAPAPKRRRKKAA